MDSLSLNISTASGPTEDAVLLKKKRKKLSWKERNKLIHERKAKLRNKGKKSVLPDGLAQPWSSSKVKSGLNKEVTPLKRKKIGKDALVKSQDNSHVQSPASAVNELDKSDIQPRGKESDNTYVPITSSLFTSNPKVPEIPLLPEVEGKQDELYAMKSFGDLSLTPHLISNIQQNFGFSTMTRVQSLVIPELIDNENWRDVLVKSKTGTGKTLAYAIPILQDLQGIVPKVSRDDGPYAVVLTPTRELAQQTYRVFQLLTKSFTWIVPGCIVGGEKRKSEKARIRKGLNIIIATPGRLVDHFENTASLGVSRVRWLVLDEADRLMEMGFSANIHTIVSLLEEKKVLDRRRRNVLLSATLSKTVGDLCGSTLHQPLFIDATAAEGDDDLMNEEVGEGIPQAVSQTPSQLDQYCVVVPAKLRLVSLAACLKHLCFDLRKKVIVFMISKRSVEFHCQLYSNALDEDLSLWELHGSMDQAERKEVYKTFCEATSGALLCTDVAARGLDLPEVDWIIQYSPPCQLSDYIHRAGRTARAGAMGKSLLFLLPHEVEYVNVLNKAQGVRLSTRSINEFLVSLKDAKSGKKTVENAATELQVRFERFVLGSEATHALAESAYQSFICGYSTYESSLKHVFHTKALHYGHVAKSFALRESPSVISPHQSKQPAKYVSGNTSRVKPKRPAVASTHNPQENTDEYFGDVVVGPKVKRKKR